MTTELGSDRSKIARFNVGAHDWKMLIGGRLVDAIGGERIDVISPATARTIATIPSAGPTDVDVAVEAARQAFALWRRVPVIERSRFVLALADAIERQGEELAYLDAVDNGSPIRVMRGDYKIAVDQLRFFANLGLMLRGEVIPTPERNSLDFTMRDPFGVVARIVPFNHPLMFAASKLGAPLVAGNTIVVKPSQHTSLSALRLGEMCAEVLPPGVVNILSGRGSQIGDRLVAHRDVSRIAFIGSVPVGRRIQQVAATDRVKVVTLELGGKNPIIVFSDADQDEAVEGVIRGMNFTWQGQSCGSTSRLYVHSSIYDGFVARVAARMDAMTVGDPLDESTEVGAVVSQEQYESDLRYIEEGMSDGSLRLLAGGLPPPRGEGQGFFLRPTLFGAASDASRLWREEIFGPVLVASPFETEDDVITRANALSLGLTASVWTNDLGRAMRMTRDIETGYLWVNWSSSHVPGASFGGVKDSGVGREEGLEELMSYTQSKNVFLRFSAG